jgi:hypothetical protein
VYVEGQGGLWTPFEVQDAKVEFNLTAAVDLQIVVPGFSSQRVLDGFEDRVVRLRRAPSVSVRLVGMPVPLPNGVRADLRTSGTDRAEDAFVQLAQPPAFSREPRRTAVSTLIGVGGQTVELSADGVAQISVPAPSHVTLTLVLIGVGRTALALGALELGDVVDGLVFTVDVDPVEFEAAMAKVRK